MSPRKKTIAILENNGYIFVRHGSNHDIYFHPEKQITIPVKRHDFDEDDMRYILKEANISKKDPGKRKGQK